MGEARGDPLRKAWSPLMNWVGERQGKTPCSAAGLAGEREEGPGRGWQGAGSWWGQGTGSLAGEAGSAPQLPEASSVRLLGSLIPGWWPLLCGSYPRPPRPPSIPLPHAP